MCHCRRATCICDTVRSFWINVYPAEGGAKVGGVNLQIFKGMPKGMPKRIPDRQVVEQAVSHLATQERLVGRFVAIYRHCYGQETTHCLPFTAAEKSAPIVCHFPPK